MMQMLGLRGSASKDRGRGGGASPSSSAAAGGTGTPRSPWTPASASSPRSPFAAEAGGEGGGGRPLRLVYCDERGRFRMDPEAVAALQLVKGPVGVVSVCGRARQGKSFILNQGTYSIQIFSLAVLLSSMFIYNQLKYIRKGNGLCVSVENVGSFYALPTKFYWKVGRRNMSYCPLQMGGIDEAALDRLSLVTEMTKHIRVRANGGRSTASELGQFSPIFIWLLRDFYLDLAENDRKITPRDYLELALKPLEGRGKDISSKNEIRESIRSLFPDRECFTLVRPLNNENELQRLDQIPLEKLRPEFHAGLDELTRFIFERTRPKQVAGTIMTGPVLAGVTQSFLDALNNGAVPTISSSWQSVEEAECRRAYDSATEIYMSSFGHSRLAEEDALRDAHEAALRKALDAYNTAAVGTGTSRAHYEKALNNFCRKAFQDYKKNAFLEADKQCSNAIQSMEKKIRVACVAPGVKVPAVIQVLETSLAEYETSCTGPAKWRMLSAFLRQCLEGPILDLCLKLINEAESERTSFALRRRSNEDQLELLKKQLEANEAHKSEYLKRYETAISEKQRTSADLSGHLANLRTKCSILEERCVSISKELDHVRHECTDWRAKFEQSASQHKAEQDRYVTQLASLESRYSSAEGKLGAAREQAASAQDEAAEWKKKYETAAVQAKTALERLASVQEQINKIAQERESAIRAEFATHLEEKEEEIRKLVAKIRQVESEESVLTERLQVAESKTQGHNKETAGLKDEIKELTSKLEFLRERSVSYEKQARMLEQEKNHLQEKFVSECKKYDEAEQRYKSAERDAKKATELADAARTEAIASQKEKDEAQRLSMEKVAVIERIQRQVDRLEQEKVNLLGEVQRMHNSESDAWSKVTLLESRVAEREKEMDDLLSRSNEQRSSTVHVLESLLATERAARAEANKRAEALSLQLQSTQGKLDILHQELTSIRLVETALDSKLRTTTRGKRLRDNEVGADSVQDMDIDPPDRSRKRTKSNTSPLKAVHTEDGDSVHIGEDSVTVSTEKDGNPDGYKKFTIARLKEELTKHGFGAQLLELKNPNKKDILALYKKHVLCE
ncbi:Guanylate-binding protein 6 [Dichanthelium oligosanthes]|uniref:Guanylate-binding protein 6 n=1 Tax=Dichanthelium oligosanthes TaxID=888268 RepID=A0A1E5V9X6_9POAL|nr:Guanylate-binding protein 6 [Dichanthelium oligosanthes]